MAGGAIIATGQVKQYEAQITVVVIAACLISSTGGLIFGYDIGISGGVTSMDMFLSQFFPSVLQKSKSAETNDYCKFDSPTLTLFTSSLYLAALIASVFASKVTRMMGRRISMLCGGFTFLAGAAMSGAAQNMAMLIIGRILLGIGIGFTNQAIPVYLSEMAPPKYRGAFNLCFQLCITFGIMMANLFNYGTHNVEGWGWRLSLALGAFPGLIITVGSWKLPDTPNSLIERGQTEKAKALLKRIRGYRVDIELELEFTDLVAASDASKLVRHPWCNLLHRRYRPQLVTAICVPFFQQMTGINVIMFYAPLLFKTIGVGSSASLLSAVIMGSVNVAATLMSIATVDLIGRRALFIEGGIQMLISQVIITAILAVKFGTDGQGSLSPDMANLVVALICIYVAGFAWSWGPLGWLFPSEIFPLEVRSAGQSLTVSVNRLFTFAVAQLFLLSLCHLKYGLFLLCSAFLVIMTLFIYLLLPETTNIPIEEMTLVWQRHWFWGRFYNEAEDDNAQNLNKTLEHLEL